MSSEVRLIPDWRERWEEKTVTNVQIHCVADTPKGRVVWAEDNRIGLATYGDSALIPKPQPKTLRPWKLEEVLVGSVVRNVSSGNRYLVTGVDSQLVYLNGNANSCNDVFDRFVLHTTSPDGTWIPTEQCPKCGVEE